jgi:hypothetical protein
MPLLPQVVPAKAETPYAAATILGKMAIGVARH